MDEIESTHPPRTKLPGDADSTVQDSTNATRVVDPKTWPTMPWPSEMIGRFAILGELARGGMGVVYRTFDAELDREVAVKVLSNRLANHPDAARRFVDEARITGQLQHPSVPPVHEVGTLPDGRPFLVMKLIKGRTLNDLVKERPGTAHDLGQFVAVFEHICQAIGYAHSKGVIHRDLKPHNIMVGAFGEVQVMDWGLAKVLGGTAKPGREKASATPITEIRSLRDSDGSFTEAGSILGTPAYMPPEQAGGEIERVDRRADVFGLGAILSVVLTGHPPYVDKDADAIRLMAIRGRTDEALARLDACGADPGLVALCKSCLSVEPDDRPPDAGAVAAAVANLRAAADDRAREADLDLVRALGDKALAEAQAVEQRKRRRVQLALACAILGLLTASVGFAWWNDRLATSRRTEREMARADEAAATERRADVRRTRTERDVTASLQQAAALIEQGEKLTDDPVRWQDVLKAANRSIRDARKSLADGESSGDLTGRVAALETRWSRAEADRVLIARIDEITFRQIDADILDRISVEAAADYSAAFKKDGIDIDPGRMQTADVSRWVLGHAHRPAVLEGIWEWWHHEPAGPRRDILAGILVAIHRGIDPFHARWVDAALRSDAGALAWLTQDPGADLLSPWAVHRLYIHLWETLQPDAAVVWMRRGLLRYPSAYRLHARLGLSLRTWEGFQASDQALAHTTAAAALRPRSYSPVATLGIILLERGDKEGARLLLRRTLENMPENPGVQTTVVYAGLGDLLLQCGDLDGAEIAYEEARKRGPLTPYWLSQIGTIHMRRKDYQKAEPFLIQANEGMPNDPTILHNLGITVAYLHRVDEGISLIEKSIEINPKRALVHFNLGGWLIARGRLAEAAKHFAISERLKKEDQAARKPSGK